MPIGTRKAKTELVVDSSKLDRGLSDGRSKFRQFGSSIGKTLGKGIKGIASYLAQALNPLGRGLDLIFGQVDDVMAFENGVARLAISQGKTNDEMSEFREHVTAISSDTGVARNAVLAGAQAYQALTGDTKGADAAMQAFARVAQATGARTEEIATSAAALSQNLKIDPADFEKAFDVLNYQGKAGAIELKDMAGELAGLAAGFQRFSGGTGIKGMQEMGAALQIVRRGFGSGAEAATGFESLMSAIVKNASKLEHAGVKVFEKGPKGGKKQLRDFAQIVQSIGESKLMKDPTLLRNALGRGEAEKAAQMLTQYRSEFESLAHTEAGAGSIEKDRAQFAQSAAGQMETAMNNLKLAAASAFTPERIQQFASAVGDAARLMGTLVDGLNAVEEGLNMLRGDDKSHLVSAKQATKSEANYTGKASDYSRSASGTIWDLERAAQVGKEHGVVVQQRRDRIEGNRRSYAAAAAAQPTAPGVAGTATPQSSSLSYAILTQLKRPLQVTVKIGDNAVAVATATATQARRRPGG